MIPPEFELNSAKNYIALNCDWEDEVAYAFRCVITNTIVETDCESPTTSQVILVTNPIDL